MKVTLYRVQLVPGELGYWDSIWFATRGAARAERKRYIEEEGYNPKLDGGEYHAIMGVERIHVELSQAGVLEFAGHYACLEA
jgi:hypothetical protein